MNPIVAMLLCRTSCRKTRFWHCKKTINEKIYSKGAGRVERGLDVRNIIKTQETLKTMMLTLVPEIEKRRLMRIQRRTIIIEPCSNSSDTEDDFKDFKRQYEDF